MPQLSIDQMDEVLRLIEEKDPFQAVKYLIENTELSLKESKELVDLLVENPNADPQFMNISRVAHAHEYDHNHIHGTMSSIITHYNTRQVFLKYENGSKVEIDEFHPEWTRAMQKFGRGTLYATKEDYLDAMQSAHTEIDTAPQILNIVRPQGHKNALETDQKSQQPNGVEDLSQKSSSSKLMIFLIVLLLAIAIISYVL